jgi:hypothetical protein
MDDKSEGRPSFKTSDVVKNEVRDVIDGDRRLTVREVANKCIISKFFPMKKVSSSRFENWTPKPSESTSYSNFTDVTSRALSTSQYKSTHVYPPDLEKGTSIRSGIDSHNIQI